MSPQRRKLPRFILSGSAAAILGLAPSAFAVDNFWTGTTNNDWNTPTNWSLGRVPSEANGQPAGDPFDDAIINILTNFPVITENLAATPRDIVVGRGAGTSGRIDHRAGSAATGFGGGMFIGREGGAGVYNLANTGALTGGLTGFSLGSGSLNVNGRLYIGGATEFTPGSVGTFNMNTTGTLRVGGDLSVGSAGSTGTMKVEFGAVTTERWNYFGNSEGVAGGTGSLIMSGGAVTNNGARTYIGLGDSTGSIQMSGGTYNNMAAGNDTFFAIGVNNLVNATTPALTMTGGTINSARAFSIGGVEAFGGNDDPNFVGSGKGTATINGATAQFNSFGELWVGQGAGSVGELSLNAGSIALDNWLVVGRGSSTGRMNMTGGNLTKTGPGHFLVGDGGGSNGTLTQSGGAIALNTGELWVGQNGGTGQYDMSSGTLSVANWTAIGRVGGNGTMNLTGGTFTKTGTGAFIVADPVNSGLSTTGVVNQSGASNLNTNEIWVGQGVGGNGTYTLSAGTLTSTGWVAIGREGGVGTLNISGTGALVKTAIDSNFIVGSLGGNGTVNQTGGSVTINAGAGSLLMGEGSSQALWDLSGGTVSADVAVVGWKGGMNELRVRDTGSLTTTGHLNVGEREGGAKGIVNQTGGTISANAWIAVGIGSPQQAEYNLSGGTTNTGNFEVGPDTPGILRLSGTGVLNTGNIEVPTRNGTAVVEISGGTLNTTGYLQGGRDGNTLGSGVTNQSGGTVNVSGDLFVQRPNVGTGAYNLSGGTLSVSGSIQGSLGTFTFTGGKITRPNPGVITFNGNLTTGAPAATLELNADKTFQVSGVLNNAAGLTLGLTGLGIPDQPSPLLAPATGSFVLGTLFSVPEAGSFDIGRTFDLGFDATFTASGQGTFTAMRINEGAPFNPSAQSVYWLDEDDGLVSLQYSIIPEPGSAALLSIAGLMLAMRRRRS